MSDQNEQYPIPPESSLRDPQCEEESGKAPAPTRENAWAVGMGEERSTSSAEPDAEPSAGAVGPPPDGSVPPGGPYSPYPFGTYPYGDVPHDGFPSGATIRRRRRRGGPPAAAAAALVLGTLAASVAIGHEVWPASSSRAASGSSGTLQPGSGSGSAGSGSFGSGSAGNGSFGSGSAGNGSFGNGSLGGGSSSASDTQGSGAPSDVSSIASKVDPGLVDVWTNLDYQGAQGAGTGIVLTSNGEILTNNHVIDGATSIKVTDIGNGRTYTANVVGYDATHDVAVLQLEGASGLKTASLGDSGNVKVGQAVVAIGNAGGAGGTPSAAGGSITALNQSITASDSLDGASENLTNLIQTNAGIQAGDSGGSLVDTSGRVIGMDTAASSVYSLQSASGGSAQGYAIPINQALSIAKQIESGRASSTVHVGATAFLGVMISSSPSSYSAPSGSGGYPGGSGGYPGGDYGTYPGGYGTGSPTSGAVVSGVVPGGAAQQAGLAAGDVITSVAGQTITSPTSLSQAMSGDHPGQSIQITWTDPSGASQTATATLQSGPPQ